MIKHLSGLVKNNYIVYFFTILMIGITFYGMETHYDIHTYIFNRCCNCILTSVSLLTVLIILHNVKPGKWTTFSILSFLVLSMIYLQEQYLLFV